MSHFEKTEYTPVSMECYIDLLINLLDQLPELLTEIAPEGFDKCIYHQVYYPGPDQAYKRYSAIQLKDYLATGCKKDLKGGRIFATKDEFMDTYVLPQANLELEAIAVYITAISAIFDDLSIVHDRRGNGFELPMPFADFVYLATHLTTAVDCFYRMDQILPAYRYEEVDYQPIYCFIFRYLKSQGLDYHFKDLNAEFKTELQEMSNPYSDSSIEMWLRIAKGKVSTKMIDQLDEITTYINNHDMMRSMDTPPVVAAYLDVYGYWPEGYL